MSWFPCKTLKNLKQANKRLLKKSISEFLFLLFPQILARERYNSTVQPFTRGLWECKNCTEQ